MSKLAENSRKTLTWLTLCVSAPKNYVSPLKNPKLNARLQRVSSASPPAYLPMWHVKTRRKLTKNSNLAHIMCFRPKKLCVSTQKPQTERASPARLQRVSTCIFTYVACQNSPKTHEKL